jgi:hypothetical protein
MKVPGCRRKVCGLKLFLDIPKQIIWLTSSRLEERRKIEGAAFGRKKAAKRQLAEGKNNANVGCKPRLG